MRAKEKHTCGYDNNFEREGVETVVQDDKQRQRGVAQVISFLVIYTNNVYMRVSLYVRLAFHT